MSKNPELDYFMNEERSDVRFIVKEKPIPALKAYLSVKSRVFHAMFSGEFKESKDKEIVIEDTTYEAFKTFIQFLYCDSLVLKDNNDLELIGELWKLADRYDFYRLEYKLINILYKKSSLFMECGISEFQNIWPKMQSILKIAFEYKVKKLMDKVMEFIDKYLYYILDEDNEVLIELNDLTDDRLFSLMVDKSSENIYGLKNKIKELFCLMSKKCKQMNELKESLKNVKSFECDKCETFDLVQPLVISNINTN